MEKILWSPTPDTAQNMVGAQETPNNLGVLTNMA